MAHSRRAFLQSLGVLTMAAALDADPIEQSDGFDGRAPGDRRVVSGLDFTWCPPGRFLMGSPDDEPGRRSDEHQVGVTLTRGFWMSVHEVTQGQWRRLVGDFPDRPPTAQFGMSDAHPVYWVNYGEAHGFCEALTAAGRAQGTLAAGWQARLPTEAQWEYACRAGTTSATAFGPALEVTDANFDHEAVPTSRRPVSTRGASPVGQYPANAWGLHDMHGNIFEWCRDWYHARLPGGVDPDLSDAPGVRNGDGSYSRCRRGGAWNDPAPFCRSASRLRYEPDRRSDHIGFRVVVERATGGRE